MFNNSSKICFEKSSKVRKMIENNITPINVIIWNPSTLQMTYQCADPWTIHSLKKNKFWEDYKGDHRNFLKDEIILNWIFLTFLKNIGNKKCALSSNEMILAGFFLDITFQY